MEQQPTKVFKADQVAQENNNSNTNIDAQDSTSANNDNNGLIVQDLEQARNSGILPEEILRMIFKRIWDIASSDEDEEDEENDEGTTECLLKCRLVCTNWKNVVDNFKYFMHNICCKVFNIPEFINSTLATKVKALCFIHALSEEEVKDQNQLDRFYNQIIPNIQMFDFDIEKNGENDKDLKTKGQQIFFTKLIKSAKDLQEIRISSPNRQFVRPLNMDEIELVGSKIKEFHLNIADMKEVEITVLREFIFSMPNLCKLLLLYLDKDGNDDQRNLEMECLLTSQVLVPHIQVFPGSLKEILFDFDLQKISTNLSIMYALTCAAMRYNLQINFDDQLVDIREVFNLCRKYEIDINEHNCGSIKNGRIHLNWNMEQFENDNNGDLFALETVRKTKFCTKLEQLELIFDNVICENNELDFLPTLKKLSSLRLTDESTNNELELMKIKLPDLIFLRGEEEGIPSLRSLIIDGSIFESYVNFPKYFPNLENLGFDSVVKLPVTLLIILGQMKKLANLTFYHCGITDEVFTHICEVSKGVKIPAIQTCKNLKSVTMLGCLLLSDACLIHGISQSTTLESLKLIKSPFAPKGTTYQQFSDVGINAIKATGKITLT